MAKTVDVNIINPFIEAALECLEQMAGLRPLRKRLFIKTDPVMHGHIAGVIGLSDGITGSCTVSFPSSLAERIVAALLMEKPPLEESMVHDGIGEVANMVAGGAKRRFSDKGFRFSISTPTVVVGSPTALFNPKHIVSVAVEFIAYAENPDETFMVEVATEPSER